MFLSCLFFFFFFFSSRRRHTRYWRDWSSDVCSSDLLGVDAGIGQNLHVAVLLSEVAVYLFNQVRAVLIAAVYAPLQAQSFHRVDMRIADDVLKMPLHRVYPTLQIQAVLNRVALIRIIDRGFNVVFHMVIGNRLVKDFVASFCKSHCIQIFNYYANVKIIFYTSKCFPPLIFAFFSLKSDSQSRHVTESGFSWNIYKSSME